MFRFQGFHMFGVFATAIPTAILSLHLIRRFDVRARNGESVRVQPKMLGRGYRYVFGGLAFGVGWALTGACPGPLLALAGSGVGVIVFVLACAVLGTWTYGHARERLPHY
ncbi:MAG: YeeE/YedE family protein [Gemmatimonadetes bacterium]|nr:YeeE/YedE family protein [Gemmatimonadota bacterium]